MPETLGDHIPSPRAALFWNGTAWQWALVDAAGHLQIDVLSTVMDAAAATEATLATLGTEATLAAFAAAAATLAEQQTQTTALQVIDNLVVALGGPGNARLIVRGEDQLFSFAGVLAEFKATNNIGVDGTADSQPCPAGHIWCVTNVAVNDITSPTTIHNYSLIHDAAVRALGETRAAIAANQWTYWNGLVWLDPSDTLRCEFIGALANDDAYFTISGYDMTLET